MNRKVTATAFIRFATVLAGFALMGAGPIAAGQSGATGSSGQSASVSDNSGADCEPVTQGSPYIPVDSWVYPAVMRLYALGYVDKVYLGLRPWTRASMSRMLDEAEERLEDVDEGPATSEAEGIYDALKRELRDDSWDSCAVHRGTFRAESVYSVERAISGTPLRDSYHLGSTIVNDYGRPYANGFNDYSGASGYVSAGRFVLYLRGEFQGAPSATGYASPLVEELAALDGTNVLFQFHLLARRSQLHRPPKQSADDDAGRPRCRGQPGTLHGSLCLCTGSQSCNLLRETG